MISWSHWILVERHAYLFCKSPAPAQPSRPEWQAIEKQVDQMRGEAVEAMLSKEGAADILRLARGVDYAQWVGKTVLESSASDAVRADLLEAGLRSDHPGEANLAHGMIVRGIQLHGFDWTDKLWHRIIRENWGPRSIDRILFALPPVRATWDRVATAGPQAETSYWKQAKVFLGGGSSEEIVYATEKLIGVGRARHAVNLLGHHINAGVPSELIDRVLRTAALECCNARETDSTDVTMLGHYVAKLINLLEANRDIGQDAISELEWAYFPLLRHSERPPRTLQKALASNPAFFVQLLCAVYLPSKESNPRQQIRNKRKQ